MVLWKSCPVSKCDVQLAWLLLTFWNIYLRLANCWMSYFGAGFLLVCLCYCWHYSRSLCFKWARLKRRQFHPIQYLHTLGALLFFFFFLLFPLYLNFFLAHANICKDTHTNLAVHTLVIHWRALYQFRRQKRQHSCCVWCVHGLKASAFSPEASPLHVTATCRVCSNEH